MFEKAEELVKEILENDVRSRNDDLWLILQVWQKKQHIKVFIPYDEIGNMMSPETITRMRRYIQNSQGLFLPSDPQVLIRRRVRSEIVRDYFGTQFYMNYVNLKYGVK